MFVCSPSFADYRPKTDTVILFDRRNWEREGKLKLESV
jgi:hypothetical protein